MNQKTLDRCVEISRLLKPKKSTGRAFHTSFAIKKGKIICVGWNSYEKPHREGKFGKYFNSKFGLEYRANLHSEIHLCVKLGEESLRNYEIVNVRVSNNNNIAASKPCVNCIKILEGLDPKGIFYTTLDQSFEKHCFK